jgi:prevent-host-death family protein
MDVIAAADAKTNFGALLDKAQREPVKISKNSRDVAVVMSMEVFNEYQEAKLQLLRRDIRVGLDDLERGAVVDGDTAFRDLEREFD